MRQPFKKSLSAVKTEGAHGGSGSRKLILSSLDDISGNLEAMTQGFLPVGHVFDWHLHDRIDEFFLVTQGSGRIEFRASVIDYKKDDLIYPC